MNTQEIGKYPQDGGVKKVGSFHINCPVLGWDNPVTEIPILPELIISTRAKPTSYITNTAIPNWFLIIKNYFIDFLNDFSIQDHQFWQLKVHHKSSIINDYSLFHLSYSSENEYVDFANSSFYLGKMTDFKYVGDNVNISSYDNYLSFREVSEKEDSNLMLKASKIVLDFQNVKEDLFRLTNVPNIGGYFVSEKLKNAIEKNKFTGMAFKEINDNDENIKVIYNV